MNPILFPQPVITPPYASRLVTRYATNDSGYVNLVNTNQISQFYDLSGNGNNTIVQGTPTSRPTFSLNQQNSLPTATFDGGDQIAPPSSMNSFPNGDNIVFAVAKRNTENAAAMVVYAFVQTGVRIVNQLRFSATAGQIIYQNNATGAATVTKTGATNTNYQILIGRYSGVTNAVTFNNEVEATNSSGAASNATTGIFIGASNGGTLLIGGIGEMLFYSGDMGSFQRTQVKNYLNAIWRTY